MRSRHWETVATHMTPGARLTHGRLSVAVPIAPIGQAVMVHQLSRMPIIADAMTRAIEAALQDGAQRLPGGIVDITARLAERAAGLEFMNIEGALSHMATSETEGEQHDR